MGFVGPPDKVLDAGAELIYYYENQVTYTITIVSRQRRSSDGKNIRTSDK